MSDADDAEAGRAGAAAPSARRGWIGAADALVPLRLLPAAMAEGPSTGGGAGDGGAPDDADPGPGLTAMGPVGSERKAREWALVLQSSEIWHVIRYTWAGWVLIVRNEDYALAASSIDRYEAENRDWPPRPARERPRHPPSPIAPLLFAALALFFLVTGPVAAQSGWFQRGTAVADLVLSSQPWRAVTALTLHADSAHVLGNVISGGIFASAVQRRLGPGGGALAILASGVAGNVANAVFHHAVLGHHHASIGASTAVFGAIGLLASTQLVLDRAHHAGQKRGWIQIVAPLVGGLALLGALGASPRADLGAHLFGLLAGVVIGLGASLGLRRKPAASGTWVQLALGAAAAAIIAGAWQLAIRA